MFFETYSYRKRLDERNDEPEVYSYDVAPAQLRHQIAMAFREGIGPYSSPRYGGRSAYEYWKKLDKICSKEIYSYLTYIRESQLDERFSEFLNNVENIDDFLDAVEIGCRVLSALRSHYRGLRGADSEAGDAIEEINRRFEQHAIGYQFENSHIVRMDSKLSHAELIKPALQLLTSPLFQKETMSF